MDNFKHKNWKHNGRRLTKAIFLLLNESYFNIAEWESESFWVFFILLSISALTPTHADSQISTGE